MLFFKPDLVKAGRLLFLLAGAMLAFCLNCAAQETPDTAIEHFVTYRQQVYKPFLITGRVIGVNLENVKGVQVVNICAANASRTDDNGIFHLDAAAGDTIAIASPKYSVKLVGIKSQKDQFNIILIKRQTDALPPGASGPEFEKAEKEDNKLLKILDKDAKAEGKWNY